MANFFGSIKRLVSMVFLEDGQDVTVEPNNSTTYTGATVYELPPKAAGTEILVGTTAVQTLSNKALVAPTFTGGAIDIPAGSTIGGSAIGGGGGGASVSGNNTWTGTNLFSPSHPNEFRGNGSSLVDVQSINTVNLSVTGPSILQNINASSLFVSGAIQQNGGSAVLDISTGGQLLFNNTWTGTNLFSNDVILANEIQVTTAVPGNIRYNTTLNKMQVFTGAAWETITSV
jgi:hypothetical protein